MTPSRSVSAYGARRPGICRVTAASTSAGRRSSCSALIDDHRTSWSCDGTCRCSEAVPQSSVRRRRDQQLATALPRPSCGARPRSALDARVEQARRPSAKRIGHGRDGGRRRVSASVARRRSEVDPHEEAGHARGSPDCWLARMLPPCSMQALASGAARCRGGRRRTASRTSRRAARCWRSSRGQSPSSARRRTTYSSSSARIASSSGGARTPRASPGRSRGSRGGVVTAVRVHRS